MPISAAYGNPAAIAPNTQLLYNLAGLQRGVSTEIVNHYDVQPVFDIYANVDQRDLGGVRSDIEKIMSDTRPHLPKATKLDVARAGRNDAEFFHSSRYRSDLRGACWSIC